MQKLLLLIIAFIILFSCNNQNKQENALQGATDTTGLEIPYIFHGWTFSVSTAELNEDGSVKKWGKLKPDTTKYALYLDNVLITIFDDSTQFHYIEEYLGKEEEAGTTWYNIATINADTLFGYVRFNYRGDSISQLYIDYPNTVLCYPLETFMPQDELDEHLSKYKKHYRETIPSHINK